METLYSWTGFIIIWSLIIFVSYCALALVSSALLAWIDLTIACHRFRKKYEGEEPKRDRKIAHFRDRMASGIVFFIALVVGPIKLYRALREEDSFWDAMSSL